MNNIQIYYHADCLIKSNGVNHPERKERLDSIISSADIASASKALDGLLNDVEKVTESVDSNIIPEIGSRVADWQGLKWVGEYHYDEDGTWYSGTECGRWKQDDDGGFTRLE